VKRILLILLVAAGILATAACAARPKLHILNFPDYMDRSLVSAFERDFDCEVVYREVGSNEEMVELLRSEAAHYDLVIPSDYMIGRLVQLGMLRPIDATALPNLGMLTVMPGIDSLYGGESWFDYAIPYAWGTLGILYDATVPGLSAFVEEAEWGALFTAGDTYDVGMYDSARDAVAAALLYYGFDVNTVDEEELAMAEDALKDARFTAWGEDSLQALVSTGTLDLALVYSGDYFYARELAIDSGNDVTFDLYVPATTNVWMDAICIPTRAEDLDLAYAFIDYMMQYDRVLANAEYIGYTPPFLEIFDAMTDDNVYDDPRFDPAPTGADRRIYRFVDQPHAEDLLLILERAKTGE